MLDDFQEADIDFGRLRHAAEPLGSAIPRDR